VHTANQEAAGLDTRDDAKTFIYAFLYGAGDGKIGDIVGGSSRDGKRLKASFQKKIPAVGHLLRAVKSAVVARGYLTGLDGRKLPCRSQHSALNLLLQSAGALIMKKAAVIFVHETATKPYEMHGNIHDEVQFSCLSETADELGGAFVEAIKLAGERFNLRCPLDGEYKIGTSWAETH
jgi:DNA polymerase I-like protein with 3'-5' exonuclease and polymerase domains